MWQGLVLGLVATCLLGCGGQAEPGAEPRTGPGTEPETPSEPSALAGPPDILLITVDTLRADHLGLYGYGRPTSPNIDRWFGDSTVFERAYATEAATAPSVVSILSGQLPQNHGVRLFYQLLPGRTKILADHLRAAGYQTGAVVSNVVLTDEAIGFGSRFNEYDDYVDEQESERTIWERNARRTTDAALAWLNDSRLPGQPHFLWVHYIDPHGPYDAPPDKPRVFQHDGFVVADINRMPEYQVDGSFDDALDYVDAYDEEIAYCDREIGRLLEAYDSLGLASEAAIVFTSDHGETMIEHEWWFTHQYHVHESIVRVPLAMRLPGQAGQRVEAPVSLIDITPTLLEMAGVALPPALDGRSLLGAPPGPLVFFEATSFDGYAQRRALVIGDDKWIVQLWRPGGAVAGMWTHDLGSDPQELNRQAWTELDVQAAARLLEVIKSDPDPGGLPERYAEGTVIDAPKVRPGVSADQLEKLRAMGYVK